MVVRWLDGALDADVGVEVEVKSVSESDAVVHARAGLHVTLDVVAGGVVAWE